MTDAELGAAVRATLAQGVTPTVNAVQVRHLFARFKLLHRADRSWRLVRNLLRPFVVRFARRPAEGLGPEDWAVHRARRKREATRTGSPPCDLTLNLELTRAKQLMTFGKCTGLALCKPVATRTQRETWLTWVQVSELLRGCLALRWPHQRAALRAWILVGVTTGMRGGEIRRLRWDRIGDRGVVTLRQGETKTRRRRVVALPQEALGALSCVDRAQSPYVFANPTTALPFNLTTVRAWFRQAAEAVGLDAAVADGDVRLILHDLRHSAASIADARGARATAIQAMLGHARLQQTSRYLHRDDSEAALEIASLMGPPRRGPKKSENNTHEVLDRKTQPWFS